MLDDLSALLSAHARAAEDIDDGNAPGFDPRIEGVHVRDAANEKRRARRNEHRERDFHDHKTPLEPPAAPLNSPRSCANERAAEITAPERKGGHQCDEERGKDRHHECGREHRPVEAGKRAAADDGDQRVEEIV